MKIRSKKLVRTTFPKVYKYNHRNSGTYYLVDGRKKKWGLNERKTFPSEALAIKHAIDIEKNIPKFIVPKEFPKEKVVLADRFEGLTVQLAHFGKTPADAVTHYVQHLGNEALKQAKPFIRDLVDDWEKFKKTDTTLSKKFLVDIRSYARFIKRTWGELKPDEPKKNQIDRLLRGLKISNNTRKAYLRYIRMFFSWVKDEDEGYITQNPTDGIKFKPDDFNGEFYTPEQTADLFRYVNEHHKDLIGYYTLLTFAGLRPSEGPRVQWSDFNFKTNQLHVRTGKTNARHITLHPLAVEWIKYHRENTPKDMPFVKLKALPNREKKIRNAVLNGKWIQDGLRHGFSTYYVHLVNDVPAVAFYMGNSIDIVKRHYARTIPKDECDAFWNLTPANVLANEPAPTTA